MKEHLAKWVSTCDQNKIKINAQTVVKEVNAYCSEESTEPGALPAQVNYSREAFVDAILEWIIAEDQVCT